MIFDVKPDTRHRGRLVADGHLTDIPLESVYSGVVSLKGLRACIFLGELNCFIYNWKFYIELVSYQVCIQNSYYTLTYNSITI